MKGILASDVRIILEELGRILRIFSFVTFFAILIPVIFGEFHAVWYFLLTSGLAFLSSMVLLSVRVEEEPRTRHAMIVAALAWVIVPLYSTIPIFFIEKMPFIDCMFECMSGWSGTGLTMVIREDLLSHSIQFWRSLMQWIGGVGVIVLMISILARPGTGAYSLYKSEGRVEKIHPSIVSTVKTIWKIFLIYTVLGVFLLWLCRMPLWDAINHSMTGIATGGFSVVDNSIGTYDSPLIDYALIPIMTAGAVSFVVHYRMIRVNYKVFFTDPQNRAYFLIAGTAIAFLAYVNMQTYGAASSSFRFSSFQVFSALTCTGFQTANVQIWNESSKLILSLAMIIGGAAGSTVGGIKLIRVILLYKGVVWKFRKVSLSPTAIISHKLGSKSLSPDEANEEVAEAGLISFLWLVFLLMGVLVLLQTVPPQYTLGDVIFEVASAQGNVGLSTGITGPWMGTLNKATLMFNMWIGRLEIIPVLMLLRLIVRRKFTY
ncbi:MAG: TrkH family potassium uptake protein [Theionarchaea archaeon]|nr:TrkH family potassium uptake protein [Theionarchaea archaeon]MBU7033920.1 TrkH family potassium uptake protein [Theionarchaea archaeon]MBU7039216.1 TrkH family potassium uptake protein [Theionarchaea archaeon]